MRRLSFAISAFLSLCAASANAQVLVSTRAPTLSVTAGQAAQLSLSGPVRDIVLGDPQVAEVSIINERTLVVMGKHTGATSLLAFDAKGRTLIDRQIVVSDTADDAVIIQRGTVSSAYACGVRCAKVNLAPAAAPSTPTP